jgi:hypothetical protein
VRKRKLSLKYDIAKKTKSIKAVMALLRSFFDKFIKKKILLGKSCLIVYQNLSEVKKGT